MRIPGQRQGTDSSGSSVSSSPSDLLLHPALSQQTRETVCVPLGAGGSCMGGGVAARCGDRPRRVWSACPLFPIHSHGWDSFPSRDRSAVSGPIELPGPSAPQQGVIENDRRSRR
ncbi:unnamed protein product [Arctogadus glacialis]